MTHTCVYCGLSYMAYLANGEPYLHATPAKAQFCTESREFLGPCQANIYISSFSLQIQCRLSVKRFGTHRVGAYVVIFVRCGCCRKVHAFRHRALGRALAVVLSDRWMREDWLCTPGRSVYTYQPVSALSVRIKLALNALDVSADAASDTLRC